VVENRKLLAEGQGFELECRPVLKGGKERPKQRNEGSSHAVQARQVEAERSTIPRLTEFLARTAGQDRIRPAPPGDPLSGAHGP